MKCSLILHFIWVFNVCQNTNLGVSSIQRVNSILIEKIRDIHFRYLASFLKLQTAKQKKNKTKIQIWAVTQENLTLLHVNHKGAEQPAHLCSFVSAFVIHSL